MTGTVCITAHAADVAVVVTAISQGLCELGTADACQPALDVIAVVQLVRAAAMKLLRCHTAEGIIGIACQSHFRTAQLVLYGAYSVFLIVDIGYDFRSCCLTRSRVRMSHHQRLAAEAVGGGRDIVTAQQVLLHLLCYPALNVVIQCRIELGGCAEHLGHGARQ